MKRFPVEPGSIVRSMAGRDEGRLFMVIQEIDEDFVLVANGRLRGMDRPKKKRRKHLKPTGAMVASAKARLEQGPAIEDHELRAWLREEEEKLVQV